MKTILAFAALVALFWGGSVGAVQDKKKEITIQTKFEFESSDKKVSTVNKAVIAADSKEWTTLSDNKRGIMLLGRLVSLDKGAIEMEYIVVDAAQKPNGVVAAPKIVTRLGKPATIVSAGANEKVEITLTAQ